MRQIVLDTETTGLDYRQGDRVIELGCIELVNRRATDRYFHVYINPDREVDAEALQVHGITNEFLSDKKRFAEIAEEFFQFIQGAEIIAHNAPFDMGFIDYEFELAKCTYGKLSDFCQIFDTLVLARKLHPGQRNSLDALCKRYKIDHFNRELHGALLDAEILAQVYLAMTGGQTTLFSDHALAQKPDVKVVLQEISVQSEQAIPVIQATEEELKLHHDFLKLLEKASEGNCIWQHAQEKNQ